MRGFTYLILIFVVNHFSANAIQCKTEDGKLIDWFVVYKLPRLRNARADFSDGLGYMYMTSENATWTISEKLIDQNDSILGVNLNDLYSKSSDKFWLSYNDQTKKRFKFFYGHTKGIIGADENEGFWLIHSIPRFPILESATYSYPETGHRNGQSILCISMDSSEIDKIGALLKYNHPYILGKLTPQSLAKIYPNLYSASEGTKINTFPFFTTAELKSKNGFVFKAYAKSSKFRKDLYEFVAQSEKASFYVETWPWAIRRLPSSCSSTYKVINVKSIQVHNANISFTSYRDHSKLAISADSRKPMVCVGDINRAKRQEKRGGGTVCFESEQHWNSYQKLILTTESCT